MLGTPWVSAEDRGCLYLVQQHGLWAGRVSICVPRTERMSRNLRSKALLGWVVTPQSRELSITGETD